MTTAASARMLATKAKLFRGFSDPSRLSILEALRTGSRRVGEIVERTGLSQPNASNHLAWLLKRALVVREQQGRFVYYALADDRVEELLSLGDRFLADGARGVSRGRRDAADRDDRP